MLINYKYTIKTTDYTTQQFLNTMAELDDDITLHNTSENKVILRLLLRNAIRKAIPQLNDNIFAFAKDTNGNAYLIVFDRKADGTVYYINNDTAVANTDYVELFNNLI